MHKHTMSFQVKPFENHGRSWTLDLQTSPNMTHHYKHYNNAYNDLSTSLITHKHKTTYEDIGDSVVERLNHPLTFDIQCI